MDAGSKEELRVYSLIQELEDRLYTEKELQKLFGYKVPLRQTRLYKYLKAKVEKLSLKTLGFYIMQGELVTGDHINDRDPVFRGKYKITAVIDGVYFTYVERGD